MKISDIVANTIDSLPTDYIFTYTDFNIDVNRKDAVIKALNRMVGAGKISRISKGKFYKAWQIQVWNFTILCIRLQETNWNRTAK